MYTIKKVWKKYGLPAAYDAQCTAKHIRECSLHVDRWKSFWKGRPDGKEANKLPGCKRAHLEEWRRNLVNIGLSPRTVNKHLATIRHILVVAEQHEIIPSRPRLEQLREPVTTKLFFRNEQIDTLFKYASNLRWPNCGIEPGLWWQCAMVLYRSYGFRTQELIAYDPSASPLTWANISLDPRSPNLESDAINELGWLFYVPPKTRKKKPTPIYLPLTKYAHRALQVLQRCRKNDTQPIFNCSRNPERFYGEWYRWMEVSGVRPRGEDTKFTPYCLRKTCATFLNQHKAGLATSVCRWGTSSEAKVAADHYVSDELVLQELHNVPMPTSFDAFLNLV